LTERFPEESFDWMYEAFDDCYTGTLDDFLDQHCSFEQPDIWVDYYLIGEYSADGYGLTKDELHSFTNIFTNDETAVGRIPDSFSSEQDDYITRWELIEFFSDFMFSEEVIAGEHRAANEVNVWPHGGEVGTAIEMNHSYLAYMSGDGKLIDLSILLANIEDEHGFSDSEVPAEILKRFSFDFEWWNDYHFVVRFVLGNFYGDFEDFNADSLEDVLYHFLQVWDVDRDIIEGVIQQYSATDSDYLTFVEQTRLIADWFEGYLSINELIDNRKTVEHLKQENLALQQMLEQLKASQH